MNVSWCLLGPLIVFSSPLRRDRLPFKRGEGHNKAKRLKADGKFISFLPSYSNQFPSVSLAVCCIVTTMGSGDAKEAQYQVDLSSATGVAVRLMSQPRAWDVFARSTH